jgi:molybdopterin synthase catalytic subunit
MADAVLTVRIQHQDFSLEEEARLLTKGRTDVGAVVSFSGLCRSEDGALTALELEHYPGMAEAEIERIVKEAAERWPVTGVTVIHRHGRITPGANIVLVVTASAHREAAFAAANFLMDFLKTRAPFWKKEHLRAGIEGGWVAAREEDSGAADRWTEEGRTPKGIRPRRA